MLIAFKSKQLSTILIEIQFLPPIAFFVLMAKEEHICLEACENYRKASFRNRAYIAGANGKQRLSVPLKKGKNEQQSIRQVKISRVENWQQEHWQSILSAYGNAPYFVHYQEAIKSILFEPIPLLYEYNLNFILKLNQLLGIEVKIHDSIVYEKQPAECIDWRNIIGPKKHYTFAPYGQVFEEKYNFISNLSILDLLFCKGPETILYLEEQEVSL